MADYGFLKFFIEEKIYTPPKKILTQPTTTTDKSVSAMASQSSGKKDSHTLLPFIGKNKSGVVVVLDVHKGILFKTKEFTLLVKIIKAIKLEVEDCAIINIHDNPQMTSEQILALNPSKVLYFGDNLIEKFARTKTVYQVKSVGKVQQFLAENLTIIERDKAKKLKLWKGLQLLFEL